MILLLVVLIFLWEDHIILSYMHNMMVTSTPAGYTRTVICTNSLPLLFVLSHLYFLADKLLSRSIQISRCFVSTCILASGIRIIRGLVSRGGFGVLGSLMAVLDLIKLCIGKKWSLSQFSVDKEHEWSR